MTREHARGRLTLEELGRRIVLTLEVWVPTLAPLAPLPPQAVEGLSCISASCHWLDVIDIRVAHSTAVAIAEGLFPSVRSWARAFKPRPVQSDDVVICGRLIGVLIGTVDGVIRITLHGSTK